MLLQQATAAAPYSIFHRIGSLLFFTLIIDGYDFHLFAKDFRIHFLSQFNTLQGHLSTGSINAGQGFKHTDLYHIRIGCILARILILRSSASDCQQAHYEHHGNQNNIVPPLQTQQKFRLPFSPKLLLC
jgi:hypothetical protein